MPSGVLTGRLGVWQGQRRRLIVIVWPGIVNRWYGSYCALHTLIVMVWHVHASKQCVWKKSLSIFNIRRPCCKWLILRVSQYFPPITAILIPLIDCPPPDHHHHQFNVGHGHARLWLRANIAHTHTQLHKHSVQMYDGQVPGCQNSNGIFPVLATLSLVQGGALQVVCLWGPIQFLDYLVV